MLLGGVQSHNQAAFLCNSSFNISPLSALYDGTHSVVVHLSTDSSFS